MNLQYRIDLLVRLGEYILANGLEWAEAKDKAQRQNGWFTTAFIDQAVTSIARQFLQKSVLETWIKAYQIPATNNKPQKIGIVMAGNIPLVGFHDWLCVFISGHSAIVKPSSKDEVLIKHLLQKMTEWEASISQQTQFAEMLKGCDAYIATGSNNSAGYFDYYFGKYPNIIRRNRTSVAVLSGKESSEELELLADDVFQYFGLGCRNVTKLYVPENYDFVKLINAFKKYNYLGDHHKFKNNYDYNLALHILNKKYYMSTDSLLLIEDEQLFSPIGQLNYSFYTDVNDVLALLKENTAIQCITGAGNIPLGQAQCPTISDYADGADTLQFLVQLG
jgi:hypothetical protein